MLSIFNDDYFMKMALKEAQAAYEQGEVPVGAVMICQNQVIAKGHNLTEKLTDVTAHAEIICLTAASEALGSKYLTDCTLYVTLEPCTMCAGALAWAQLGKVVYGASDEKRGFARLQPKVLHPRTVIIKGVLEEECGQLVKDFFKERR
ncbi:MAG: nucleoside deaminase [Saprospiraceae bacterium]